MKNIFSMLMLIVVASFVVNSCSDSSTTPSDTKELFPSTAGSYWIYDGTYKVDGQDMEVQDSTVISGTETIDTKLASKFSVYVGGELSENYFRYSQDSKLYARPTELLPAGFLALIPSEIIPAQWVVIADNKSSNWNMFSFNVSDLAIEVGGSNAVLNGVVDVTGQKGSTVNITVNDTTRASQEFNTKIAYTGTVNYMGINLNLAFEVNTKSYFADKIGLVKSETPEQVISVNVLGQNYPLYTIEASSRVLARFNIAL
jgi:hypothetical protein